MDLNRAMTTTLSKVTFRAAIWLFPPAFMLRAIGFHFVSHDDLLPDIPVIDVEILLVR